MAVTEDSTATFDGPAPAEEVREASSDWGVIRRTLFSLEIDTRMFGLILAMLVIWIGFHFWTGGTFLTPRNLWTITVQTAIVAIMATGMVLVIVSRNIDLSVGSMLGFVGMFMALMQAEWLPSIFGFDQWWTWIVVLIAGIVLGGLIGLFQGAIVAYAAVPSFIVTLGGLLVWRGLLWVMARGRTIAPMDATFQLLGGGARGTVGGTVSWIIGIVASIAIVLLLISRRRNRLKFGFRVRPLWADIVLMTLAPALILGTIWFLNQYYLPIGLAEQYVQEHGLDVDPADVQIPFGLANLVLIAIGTAIVMSFVATRRRFGRYVYAIGGNPEAAQLSGIPTKRLIMFTFMVMGILVGLAAAVQIARLNSATAGLGTLQELYVIAAAVIGGTSLTGGVGTIFGAVLGALFMQSLQSGMSLVGLETQVQDVVVGVVLVAAVAADVAYRKRLAR
ncbi:MAG TPA: sugar ABC transporter permease [Acidimicrobiia bacterium]|jgi:D-xylose transport system permease protein|nr:sugar ABC transporter permease [Acidimicrobiia bacterium]